MKKIVLIMVSVLILTIFVSFNYLLWYRGEKVAEYGEKIKQLEEDLNKGESVSASKIDDYKDQVITLNQDILSYKSRVSSLETNNDKLKQDNDKVTANNSIKNAIISKLKLQADLEPLKEIIRNWVDYIDKAKYEEAYKILNQDSAKSRSEFISMYRNIKGIKVNTIELMAEGIPNDKKGDIIFKVVVDVTKMDETASGELIKGSNDIYFTMTVNEYRDEWVIADIPSIRLN